MATRTAWARIESGAGYRHQLTDQDVLWAARMAAFEGGNAADSLWAVTQRAALQRRGFTSAARAFSQPINPLWAASGACCCGSVGVCPTRSRCGDLEHCSPRQLARRRLAQSISLEELRRRDPDAVRKTLLWAQAKLSNPVPRVVNFATPEQSARFVAARPGSRVVKRSGNWYIAEAASTAWPRNFVTMRLGDRIAGASSPLPGLVVLGGAGLLGYALLKRRGLLGELEQDDVRTASLPGPSAAAAYRDVLQRLYNLRGAGMFEKYIGEARRAILRDAGEHLKMPSKGRKQLDMIEAEIFSLAHRGGLASRRSA